MLRRLVCGLVLSTLSLACGGTDHPPPLAEGPIKGHGDTGGDGGAGADPGGGKKTAQDLREGGFFNLPQVSDILWDDARGVLYASTTQGVLATITLSDSSMTNDQMGTGPLLGLDLSPSGDKLVICENAVDEDAKQFWIHIADFRTGMARKIYFDQFYYLQEGTHGAAFADDDTVFFATSFVASGYVPLVRLNLAKADAEQDTSEELEGVVSDTMFARSLDNSTLVFAEPKDGMGPVHVVDTSSLELARGTVGQLLHDIAINTDASRLALPVSGKVVIRTKDSDGAYSIETSIEQQGREARSAIFSPVSDSIYVTWGATFEKSPPFVERYNLESLESEGIIQNGIKLADSRVGGFEPTRMKISNDGRLLFITVATGINVIAVEP